MNYNLFSLLWIIVFGIVSRSPSLTGVYNDFLLRFVLEVLSFLGLQLSHCYILNTFELSQLFICFAFECVVIYALFISDTEFISKTELGCQEVTCPYMCMSFWHPVVRLLSLTFV